MIEILAIIAGTVIGFSIESEERTFQVPEMAFQKLGTAVRKPVGDVDVRIRRREGWENVRWRFEVIGEGTVDFQKLVGDNAE